MAKKKQRADDDLRDVPTVQSRLSELGDLRLFTGKGDRVVRKLDKEAPDAFMAVKYIDLDEGRKVLVLDSQEGFIGVTMAKANPGSSFYLYDLNVAMSKLSVRNTETNYHIDNARVLDEEGLDKLAESNTFDTEIYSPKEFTAIDLIEDKIAFGLSILEEGGEFYLVTTKKQGGERHQKILEELLQEKAETVAKGKGGYRIFKGIKTRHIKDLTPERIRRKVNFRILGRKFELETEPFLFSKDDLDVGTRFLLESVDLTDFERLLDVGCGWGAIGIVAASVNPEGCVVMTDIDRRATRVAADNARKLELEERVEIIATDDLHTITGNFDLVLSNPPFHADMGTLKDIFTGARDKLSNKGRLYLVVEQTYLQKLQQVLDDTFGNSRVYKKDPEINFFILLAR